MNLQDDQGRPQTAETTTEGVEETLRSFEGEEGEAAENVAEKEVKVEGQLATETVSESASAAKVEEKSLLSDSDITRLAAAIKPESGSQNVTQTQQQPKRYTSEEIKKLLNVYEPPEDFITRLSDPTTAGAAMAELVAGIRKEFNTLLQVQLATTQQGLNKEIAPVREKLQRDAEDAAEKAFFAANKDLDTPQAKEVLEMVVSKLASIKAFDGKKSEDVAKLLAGETRAALKRLGVSANATASGTPQKQTVARKPATLSNGAGGGAHSSSTPASTGSVSDDLRALF